MHERMDERLLRAPGARAEHDLISHARAADYGPSRRVADAGLSDDRLMRHDPPRVTVEGLVNRPDW